MKIDQINYSIAALTKDVINLVFLSYKITFFIRIRLWRIIRSHILVPQSHCYVPYVFNWSISLIVAFRSEFKLTSFSACI